MNRLIASGTCIIILIIFAVMPLVEAQTNAPQNQTQESAKAAQLADRVKERKERLKVRLSNNQSKRISLKCGGAQGKLNSLAVRFDNSDNPYRKKYDNFLQRLEKLQTRLKEKNVDTAKLNQNITVLKQKIQTLKTTIEQFKLSVNDAKAVDCKNDPAGFKAALDEARIQNQAVKTARADLEAYKATIKAAIEEIKTTIKAKQD